MGGDVETIKERLDIAEIVSGYVKLEKAGVSFKGRCPFHNEKTPSFFVSPVRQSYYCFGCGAKGDIFTFVEELEGLSFREALKMLAERAGIELEYRPEAAKSRSEKERLLGALETATLFFEDELKKNEAAQKYIASRGIDEVSVRRWRLGYAPAEWRALYSHMLALGYDKETLVKTGLVRTVVEPVVSGSREAVTQLREPYDVFRDRIIFPLSDASGDVIAFSGRALKKETEPKYINSPDTVLFTKSEVLYGLDKAKEKIRRKDYAVLVEGQMDLVLSHQAGVDNAVASSGTAFTRAHLERLKRLSKRIILAFDGDSAGGKAAEKATELAMNLGLEVKIAALPSGQDPAELVKADPQSWKEVLRKSLPAIEHFLNLLMAEEKDERKLGLTIGRKLLPMVSLLSTSIEKSHFASLIARKTGLKEDVVWEDLRRVVRPAKVPDMPGSMSEKVILEEKQLRSRKEVLDERLTEVRQWLKELPDGSIDRKELLLEEKELLNHLEDAALRNELSELTVALRQAETSKEEMKAVEIAGRIQALYKKVRALEG